VTQVVSTLEKLRPRAERKCCVLKLHPSDVDESVDLFDLRQEELCSCCSCAHAGRTCAARVRRDTLKQEEVPPAVLSSVRWSTRLLVCLVAPVMILQCFTSETHSRTAS